MPPPPQILISVTVFYLIVIAGQHQVQLQQTFFRDCNDPQIVGHQATFGHSYCSHTCAGSAVSGGTSTCTADGYCLCPCDPAAPAPTFATDLCPQAGDIPDTDAGAVGRCTATCAGLCTGGQGMICGDIGITNAKVCTCICPPTSCPGTEVAANNATATTAFVFIPFPFILKKLALALKIYGTKLYIYGLFGFSLLMKLLYLKFVFFVLYEIFLVLLNRVLRRVVRLVTPLLRRVVQMLTNHFTHNHHNLNNNNNVNYY